ncbi:hypothetical protein OLN43_13985, partial [Acinetobacter baumannii]|nr:hypothetical protein [Acinetobacter baumannii]
MTLSISNQYTILNDLDGKPLDSGYLFIGEAGKNPEVYPIPVFWDEDFTKPAHQPITTRNGFIYNNGGPSKLYANVGSCSIIVKNKKKVTVYTDLNVTATSASSIFDGDESQKDINDKSLAMCETVAQLRTLKPRKDGAVMFVKSHSNNGSGGVNYIWNEDSLLPDDDGYIIKSETTDTGRWIADYGTSPITPRHFGAKGDGENDERLQCEKSIVVAAKLKIKWLVQKDDIYLLNSYANYSEIAHFSAGLLPLFSE